MRSVIRKKKHDHNQNNTRNQ